MFKCRIPKPRVVASSSRDINVLVQLVRRPLPLAVSILSILALGETEGEDHGRGASGRVERRKKCNCME